MSSGVDDDWGDGVDCGSDFSEADGYGGDCGCGDDGNDGDDYNVTVVHVPVSRAAPRSPLHLPGGVMFLFLVLSGVGDGDIATACQTVEYMCPKDEDGWVCNIELTFSWQRVK